MPRNDDHTDEGSEQPDEAQIEEEFSIWKRNTVFLYDLVIAHALLWPSLTVEWFPTQEVVKGHGVSKQRMLLGTHTSGGEQNHLMVAEVALPLEDAELEDKEGDRSGFATAERYKIVHYIPHDGEVNRARLMPQDANIVATKTASDQVYLFKLEGGHKQGGGDKCRPDVRLTGHTAEGFGLRWSKLKEGYLISGSNDHKVCVWDVASAQGKSKLAALHTFSHHTDDVEDVAWHCSDANVFGSVGCDKQLCLWDLRAAGSDKGAVLGGSHQAHDDVVNCLAFHPSHPHLLVTGSADHSLALWDTRALDRCLHSMAAHKGEVVQVQWNEHYGNILASGAGGDNRVMVWDLNRIGDEQTADEADDGPPELMFIHGGHSDRVSDFCWNPLRPWLITSVADDNIMQIWQMAESLYEDDTKMK